MLDQTRQPRTERDSEQRVVIEDEGRPEWRPTEEGGSTPSQLARLLYGGVLAFMALDNLRNLDERVAYAEAKGAPAPDISVPANSAALLGGGIGIAMWRLPRLAALAVASFFLSVTPVMHDFWNEEGEERANQQIHFMKNSALLGAALAFFELGRRSD